MYDAIVLAGGAGRRLGGVDKAALEVGGQPLLDRALSAVAGAGRCIVVGPRRLLPTGVVGASEDPPGGGPVAGVAAGLELVSAPLVVVLACDLPFVTAATIGRLLDALAGDSEGEHDGAQLIDPEGVPQPLTAVYRTDRLAVAVAALGDPAGTPMRHVLRRLIMLDVEAAAAQTWDCDTWEDLDRARLLADRHRLEES